MAAGALAVVLAFGAAAVVRPDARGYGTHERFSLRPCTFRLVFGRPCPTCGMTTAWSHLVRGRLGDALRANIGGTMLALGAMVAAPWLAVSAIRGHWWPLRPRSEWVGTAAIFVGGITLVQWVVRLVTG